MMHYFDREPSPSCVAVSIPKLHPLSPEYALFWKEQIERCRYGYWIDGYYFVPPALYFYANFATIKKQLSPFVPSTKVFARPSIRDLEWMFHAAYLTVRGFSGFSEDDVHTSLHVAKNVSPDDTSALAFLSAHYPNAFTPEGKLKKWIDPYRYLLSRHDKPLGKPLFENEKKNFLFLGSRDLGKSYLTAGVIAHMFLFDNPPYEGTPAEIVVGASLSDKSSDLLKKVKDILDFLPGAFEGKDRSYPSPLSKQYIGSFANGREIVATYRKKLNGKWVTAGSRSTIKHVSFRDNPFAAQGTRPDLLVVEEVGLSREFKDIYLHTVDALRRGLTKTGTLLAIGTGGDMESGTLPVSEIFFEPEKYDFLAFEDIYENRSEPIAFFVPATYSLDDMRNENGFVQHERARQKIVDARKAKKSSFALEQEMQYRPLVPSEMFLSKTTSLFPVLELKRRLSEVKLQPPPHMVVDLYFDPASPYQGVNYTPIDAEPLLTFPTPPDASRDGAIVVWELPYLEEDNGKRYVPEGAYIIGCDPFRDDTPDAASLAAIYVMKTSKYPTTVGFEQVVACYVGRPYLGKAAVNEILFKLALFYRAKVFFENTVGNVKDYFEKVRRLDLLATQPVTLFNKRASAYSSSAIVYGYPMPNHRVKLEAVSYLRDWLLTARDDRRKNLDLLPDPALLQELMSFTMEGNYDRVMAFIGCIIGLEETTNLLKRKLSSEPSELQRDFDRLIVNNPSLFYARELFPATKASLFEESR